MVQLKKLNRDATFYQVYELVMINDRLTEDELIQLIKDECKLSDSLAENYFDAAVTAIFENRL